jgi:SAM-dependent methyltransferase
VSTSLQDQVKELISQPGIHDNWETTYRIDGIERLWEQIYDDFVARIGQPAGSHALDIGCGPCFNSIRLARRGYRVTAADYSEAVLPHAREVLARENLSDAIHPTREDLLNLSFPADTFDLVLAQGVLMHVPDLERAIAELARVVKPGGFVVLEELNQGSPEAWIKKLVWSVLKPSIKIERKPAGDEFSADFEGGTVFWRHTNARWFAEQFARNSCERFRRDTSMCTEAWKYVGPLKGVVHAWNRLWARHLNLPRLAYHNLTIFRKK